MSDPFGVFGEVPAVSDPGAAAVLGRALAAPMGADRFSLLAKVDGRLLDAAARVDHMVAWQQCVAWASAHSELSVALVAGAPPEETGRREPSSKPTGNIAEDDHCATVSTALHATPYSAKNRMEAARSAADEHAPVARRMLAGEWTGLHLWHARSATAGHPTGLARVAVANVCATPGCETWTPGRLARRIRAELVRLDSEAIAKRIRRRRHQRSAHLDPTDDLHGVITVDAAWETVVWAFGVFRRWAETERDRLRTIRKQDPAARFCCPQAMARLLTHSNHSDTATTSSSSSGAGTGAGAGAGTSKSNGSAGAGAGAGADDDTSSNPGSAGRGHAGGRGNSGGSARRDSGANGSDGHDAGRGDADRGDAGRGGGVGADGVDPFAGVGPDDDCPFCGQPDAGVPDLAALTADAVIAAAGLLAGTIGDPATTDHAGSKVGKRWGTAIVVVDLPTAFGLADNPGHVPGYGDVPAGIARELLHHAQVWRRFLIDDSGVLTDTGAGTYRPSEKLRDHIQMRDWTCTFPGCGRPASQADLDHIINFNGTNTTASNLHVLCRTHHRIKTYAGWTPQRQPDGTTVWTSPDGHTYANTNDTPWTHHTTADSTASNTPNAAGSAGQQPSAGRATSDHADARNADARGTMGQPGDNAGHGPNSGTQPTNDGPCPRAWFDAQTLHTDHIIITFGNDDDTTPADRHNGPAGGTDGTTEAGPTSGTEGAPAGATEGGTVGGTAGRPEDDTTSAPGNGPAGDQAGDAAQSSGGARRGGSDHSAARRHRGSAADGTHHKPWLDNPAEPPPPPTGDTGNPHTATHWPPAPYTPAEHALHNLITAHHTPPARAP